MWNNLKTVLLLGLLSGLLVVGGGAIGGRSGLVIALVLALAMNFFSYFFSEKMALAAYNAQPVTPQDNPQLYRQLAPMVERLCQRMNLPMPKLWVIPDHSPNAFATGRDPQHSSVAVTYGLLELMDEQELEAVIGHELGHILNRDILVSSVAAMIGSAITFLAQFGYFLGGGRSDDEEGGSNPAVMLGMMLVAPIAAMLIQMAISRTREYGADAAAARYTGSKVGMIRALRRLESYAERIPMNASPATAHMFIVKPFSVQGMMSMFSTHPSTEKRIAALEALSL